MARFYGMVEGSAASPATRMGHREITATVASYEGAIETRLFDLNGEDWYEVWQRPWKGSGVERMLARGRVGRED